VVGILNKRFTNGELKEILIHNGLQLLNEVGYQNFSMRKVASMSGVSHAAPYKHFKTKKELLTAISMSAMESFKSSLKESMIEFKDKPNILMAEMGIKYVQFMVENPEHMKFLFLTSQKYCVKIVDNHFEYAENSPFAMFKETATSYLDSVKVDNNKYVTDILSIWSIVHGISVLIVEKSIAFENDYLDYVSKMIYNRLR
jgi:AcrR family transcriptional regulator